MSVSILKVKDDKKVSIQKNNDIKTTYRINTMNIEVTPKMKIIIHTDGVDQTEKDRTHSVTLNILIIIIELRTKENLT